MDNKTQGQIITFYSYKGGTGRTMTLANVACLLAEQQLKTGGKGVLMMDWDLEAPGLHRYFHNKLAPKRRFDVSRSEDHYDQDPGLIDLFYDIDERIVQAKADQEKNRSERDRLSTGGATPRDDSNEDAARHIFESIDLDKYIIPTKISGLSLMKAGRFNVDDANEYPQRVNKFNWEALYQKSPQLMRVLAEILAEKYDYVLIDSRTGVTDISGVCTMLLPEKLVVVFTPNMQSLTGAVEVVRRATDYRKESDDLRPLFVYPLVSRVEANEPTLRHDWRFGNAEKNIAGYQVAFESVLEEAYQKDEVRLDKYFNVMQIQHIPHYAYGEEIAVLEEKIEDKFSLRASYKTFVSTLLEPHLPWEGHLAVDDSFDRQNTLRVASVFERFMSDLRAAAPVVAVLSIAIAIFAGYSASTSGQELDTLKQENASLMETKGALEQKLTEYQKPAEVIRTKDKLIDDLYIQIDQATIDTTRRIDELNQQLSQAQKNSGDAQQKLRAAVAAAQQGQQNALQRADKTTLELSECRKRLEGCYKK